jgi:recombinational DNA repair protein RecR
MRLPKDFKFLVNELEKLPGLGPKSAMRLAIHLVNAKESNALALSTALSAVSSVALLANINCVRFVLIIKEIIPRFVLSKVLLICWQ